MDRAQLSEWLDGYERLWRTEGTDELSQLFSADAFYSTGPFEEPFRGLEAIAAMWESERQGHDEAFTTEREIVAVERSTAVVRMEVIYGEPKPAHYRDIWIIRLDEAGCCTHFEEWPFWPEPATPHPYR